MVEPLFDVVNVGYDPASQMLAILLDSMGYSVAMDLRAQLVGGSDEI
jgi:hypothetical protein